MFFNQTKAWHTENLVTTETDKTLQEKRPTIIGKQNVKREEDEKKLKQNQIRNGLLYDTFWAISHKLYRYIYIYIYIKEDLEHNRIVRQNYGMKKKDN